MKNTLPLLTSAIIGLASTHCIADSSGPYIGAKTGTMQVNLSAYDDVSANGLAIGYNINKWLGLEFELVNSSSGDYDFYYSQGEYEISTRAFYTTFRTPGAFYFKGKGGIIQEELEISRGYDDDDDNDEIGGSVAVALGCNAGPVSFEVSYTLVEEDVTYTAAGLYVHF